MSAEKTASSTHGQDSVNDNGQNKPAPSTSASSLLGKIKAAKEARKPEVMSVDAWMELCKTEPAAYQNFADRMLTAIGEPEIVDTKLADTQTRLIHGGKKIARYKPFADMYDAEDTITKLVTYLKNGAQGMLVLLGPVGSGKTEIATTLEKLTETVPLYLLKCKKTGVVSPFNDHPLCLLSDEHISGHASEELGIPKRYLKEMRSAWVTKRLRKAIKDDNGEPTGEYEDIDPSDAFEVAKVYPSRETLRGIEKLDPKDPKTADMASLVGSVDLSKVGDEDPLDPHETLRAGDPDAYKVGAFSHSHGGMLHAAEFFRNNPALLNAFLEGVTTGYFTGNGGVGMLPMNQLIVITSNSPVWKTFKASNESDAARNRIEVIEVPYTLRMSEELKIYEKLLQKKPSRKQTCCPRHERASGRVLCRLPSDRWCWRCFESL